MAALSAAQKTIGKIKAMLPNAITSGVVLQGQPVLYVPPEKLTTVATFLKHHTLTRCKQLIDITAVDVPTREKRFEVNFTIYLYTTPILTKIGHTKF